MNQSPSLYDMASALETLVPRLEQHLPDLDPAVRRHFVQLVTGIIEQQSLLIRAIAAASPFQAEPESNDTQVQRIIRDTRLTLETVYYPFLTQILAALPGHDDQVSFVCTHPASPLPAFDQIDIPANTCSQDLLRTSN